MKAYFAKFASWGHGFPREQMWVFSKFRRYCDLLFQILIGQIWIYLGRSSMYLSTYLMFNFIWINIGFQCISAHTDLKTCNVQVGQWGAIILNGLQKKRKTLRRNLCPFTILISFSFFFTKKSKISSNQMYTTYKQQCWDIGFCICYPDETTDH